MRRTQSKAYSLEFRDEALRRVQEATTPIHALAQGLGLHVETLRNWRRNARLKEEREIPEKATAFFARDAR